jgi:hypothetical protein
METVVLGVDFEAAAGAARRAGLANRANARARRAEVFMRRREGSGAR